MSFLKNIFNSKNYSKGNIIITIDREHGTNSMELAKEIADKLNLKIYDENVIELKTLESKVDPNKITKDDSFLQGTIYDLYRENYSYSQEDISAGDAAFLAESKTIRNIAKEGNCILLGKCANYVLKENYKTVNIFICGDYEDKLNNISNRNKVEIDQAKAIINKVDNRRKNHYNRYTDEVWGEASNYDICFNVSRISKEKICNIILKVINS